MGLAGNNNNPVTRFNGIRVGQALLGTILPIVIGQQRLSWRLLWYGAFSSKKAKQQGGSGLAKGGSQYVYSASVVGSVCLGNCQNFLAVWDSIGRYAMDTYSESTTLGSTSYTPANQFAFKQDLGVGINAAYSVVTNDYGSPGSSTLTGSHFIPLVYTTSPSPLPGQYTINSRPVGGPGGGNAGTSAFAITSVANTSGGNTVYTGTITGGAANAYVNYIFVTKNSNFPANNGQFTCVASTATTLTLNNPNGRADVAVMTALIIASVPVYVFNAGQVGSTVIVNYTAYRYHIQEDELSVVPVTPFIVTVQFAASYRFDVGVKYYPSGIALTSTSDTPTTGQYNPNNGNYKFSAGDQGAGIVISYIYADPNVDNNTSGTINLTFFGGGLGQSVWSYLTSAFPAAALGYSEVAYVASSGLYLGYSPVLPQYNFEILGPYSFGKGIPDANPADAIYGLLTAPIYKLNFPVLSIGDSLLGNNFTITGNVTSGVFTSGEVVKQTTTGAVALMVGTVTGTNPLFVGPITGPADGSVSHTWVGQTSAAVYTPTSPPSTSCVKAMWSANSFFISDVIDSQSSLMNIISKWCEAGQCYISFDEGILKFIPLSDTSSVGHGAVYAPPTQPVIDLDDNDFAIDPNKDPITIEQTPWQNRWNRVGIRWDVRTNDYNQDIYQVQDEASVQQYGLMSESAQDYGFITTLPAAQFAGNMRLQRYSAIYTTYKFTLKSNFAFLSPGDIITITDGLLNTAGTMFGRTPCRIVKMTDDPKAGIQIEAENFPWSVGAALLYNAQAQLPSNTNDGPQENPGPTTAIIFEVPNQVQQFIGRKIYIFLNGSNSNWGGAEAYISLNGVDYSYYGQYDTPGRIGVTTATFPTVATGQNSLDNTNTLSVSMQQSGSTLQSVTAPDRDALVTLSALVSPGAVTTNTNIATVGLNQNIPTNSLSPHTAGTGADDGSGFTVWSNPGNVSSNVSFATNILGTSARSNWLRASNFGFALAPGSIIGGIVVTFNASSSAPNGTESITAELLNILALRPSLKTVTGLTSGSVQYTLGYGSDTWGATQIPVSNVNSSLFGLQFLASNGSPGTTISIDNVQITLYLIGSAPVAWFNPQNVGSLVSLATATLAGNTVTQWILTNTYGFNLPFGFVLTGIGVAVTAVTGSGTMQLTASLIYNGVFVGQQESATVTPGLADAVFGSSVDLWSAAEIEDVDHLNSSLFGVAFFASGFQGQSIGIQNVRITLYGTSASNLELVSYQTATLTGLNSYNLTSIRRGVQGSYPCAHPSSSTFVRLDQATIEYQVPSNFQGSTIFFKFLSFNAYGNQLQSLSAVVPYDVVVTGLAPGAIDPVSGALRTGTKNYDIPHIDSALSAVHGDFGIQNIPGGYIFVSPPTQISGTPKWMSLSGDSSTGGAAPGVNDMYIYTPVIAGTYSSSQELYYSQPVRNLTLPANLTNSNGGCRIAPTSSVQVSLKKNGVQFATVNIAGGATTATVTMASSVSFSGTGDTFSITAPAVVDATFAGFWLDIYASRAN